VANKHILDSWLKCVKIGGLELYLVPKGSKRASMIIEWHPYPGGGNPIIDSFVVDGAQIKKKNIINEGDEINGRKSILLKKKNKACEIYVDINLILNGESISKEVYLPPIVNLPTIEKTRKVKYEYAASGDKGTAIIPYGGTYEIYNQEGCGPHRPGRDIARCMVTSDGLIQAYNADCDGKPVTGGAVNKGSSVASYKGLKVICTPVDRPVITPPVINCGN
jgi:hypothetical protein